MVGTRLDAVYRRWAQGEEGSVMCAAEACLPGVVGLVDIGWVRWFGPLGLHLSGAVKRGKGQLPERQGLGC